jgi:hypothetical protein
MSTKNIASIEMNKLESVVGGTFKQGVAERAAGQAEINRSLAAAGQAASAARSAQYHQTLGQDMAAGQGFGARVGGWIGEKVAAVPGFVHGIFTGERAFNSTLQSELNK